MKVVVKSGRKEKTVKVIKKDNDIFTVSVGNKIYQLDIVKAADGIYSILYNGRSIGMEMLSSDNSGSYKVNTLHNYFEIDVVPATGRVSGRSSKKKAQQNIKAPMSGKIVMIKVKKGDKVKEGTPLLVLSAMKMENEIRSEAAGIVEKIEVKEDDLVKDGQLLIEIKSVQ